MATSPMVPNMTLDPYPRERCVDVDGKRSVGRKELRHPPSSNMRGGKGQIFGRDRTKRHILVMMRLTRPTQEGQLARSRTTYRMVNSG
jgi:hypothetical protein